MSIVDKTENAVSRVYSYATDNKEKIGKNIVNGVLLFVILAVFGCFDFAHFEFNISRIFQISYWTSTIAKAIAGICAYNIGINFTWDKEIEKDTELKENAEKYQRLNKLKDQKTFNVFVIEYLNRREKKKAYINQINRKIYLLNRFARNKNKLLYSSDKESDIEKKKKNRYCIKRQELEDIKSDEFIEKNLDSLKVKYHYIDPIVFELELDNKGRYYGIKVSGNVGLGKAKATANVFIGMLGLSMITTSIMLSPNQDEFANQMMAFWNYLLTACEDIGIVVWQSTRGMVSSRKIISRELTAPLVGRNIVLTEYNEWCVEYHIEKSKSYQIYNAICESESVK